MRSLHCEHKSQNTIKYDLTIVLWRRALKERPVVNQMSTPCPHHAGKELCRDRTGNRGLVLQSSQTLHSLARFHGAPSSTWT